VSESMTAANTGPTAAELARLLEAFNSATARLAATHDALTAEVARLKSELTEARGQVERTRHLALLGEMAAGIAHEVRNPLGSIRLYARMLSEDLADRPEQQAVARKIDSAVVRLDAVVTDVLAFSRQTRLRPGPLDGEEVIASAAESARGDGPEWNGVEVKLPGAGVNAKWWGDGQLLVQALVNLIRNAAQAIAEGGSPTGKREVRVELLERRVLMEDGRSVFMRGCAVVDTGPGIAGEMRERLFQPFATTRHTGTGLGLAIVHRIIDAHAGRIAVTSGPEGGARFEVLLPVEGDQASGEQAGGDGEAGGEKTGGA
jgi:signal transduction histidine kinase